MEGVTSTLPRISDLTGRCCPKTIRTRYIDTRSHRNGPGLGCQELTVGPCCPPQTGPLTAPPLTLTC